MSNSMGNRAVDAAKELTKPQRALVRNGCVSGDFSMVTVRSLKRKGIFHLVIDSPNGQCGFMRLTPFGEAVQAALIASEAERKRREAGQ